MGFWLDLPIGLPSASCFQHIMQPLAFLSPLRSNISVFTYWSPHSVVTSDSLSNMGKVSTCCNLPSYGSYCDVSFTHSSTESLASVWGPSLWRRDFMIELCSAFHSFWSHSSWVSAWYVDLWRTWPFSLMIFAVKMESISMLRPSYLFSLVWSSGYSVVLKHYPFKPFKLTELANVGCLSRHNNFMDFPIQFVDAVCSIGTNVGLKFKVVIPKSLRVPDLMSFLLESFFVFFISQLHLSMGWRAPSVSNDKMTPWFSCWTLQGSFLWHCHILLQVALQPTEKKGTMPHGLHFPASWGMRMTNQNWWQKSMHTYCIS